MIGAGGLLPMSDREGQAPRTTGAVERIHPVGQTKPSGFQKDGSFEQRKSQRDESGPARPVMPLAEVGPFRREQYDASDIGRRGPIRRAEIAKA